MSLAERYELLSCIHDSRSVSVHRARDKRDGTSVILKVLKPAAAFKNRLRHEFDILKQLDLPRVVQARDLEQAGSEMALVLEDLGGETLSARASRGLLPLSEVLRIGAELAGTLGTVHHRRVIHKDVNPNNILLDDGGRVFLFDFDIATRVPREIQSVITPNQLAGTLRYISPEQTGRMNRAIDYRTDLYSLGATLYALLTGEVPFSTPDPIELIHSHIAKVPVAPSDVDPSIPTVVSDIVMKLLAKTAEQRYQSALGLKSDLEECQSRLTPDGRIEPFPLAQRDISDRFQIPQKLYGREAEISVLEAAFARARQGTPELFLVTGSSGSGKSSTIHELYRSMSQTRGYFVAGKFDQLKRNIPYSALLQAFSELIRILLGETDAQLSVIRRRIISALRGVGRVLTDVLPDLAHIIGPQPTVQELPGAEAGNRFRIAFESFLKVFTQHGEPLVIFLDDLQWADAATLDLLGSILGGKGEPGALLVIGAYRDNEVSQEHPLLSMLAKVEKDGCRVARTALGPIDVTHIRQLCAETLALDPEEVQSLANLLWQRTRGNPLFVGELLTMFYKHQLLDFDPVRGRWSFDLLELEKAACTDNVGELMAARAASLSDHAQEVLKLAAVLGSSFELTALSIVAERSPEETAASLEEALREGLVLSIGREEAPAYRFLHDRVQQAIYASIPDDTRLEVHHRAGRLLLANRPERDDDWRFAVLHHLNLAAALVREPERRIELARLNHAAVRSAKSAAAFATAVSYARAGIGFMPPDTWMSHHELMFDLHLDLAECEYLRGDNAVAEQAFETLLQAVRVDLERVQVYELMSRYNEHRTRYEVATRLVHQALEILGITMTREPKMPHVMRDLVLTKLTLRGRSAQDLLNAPDSRDPHTRLVLRILTLATNIAYFADPKLFITTVLRLVRVSAQRGNWVDSALGYSGYGMVLVTLGEYDAAEAFSGQLALGLTERYLDKRIECRVKMVHGIMIVAWKQRPKDGIRYMEEALQCGLMAGDLAYAGHSLNGVLILHWVAGQPLDQLYQRCLSGFDVVRKINFDGSEVIVQTFQHAALALQGLTRSAGSFDTDDFDEASLLAQLNRIDSKVFLHAYWICKIVVLYVLDRHEEALAISEVSRKNADTVLGPQPQIIDQYFYDALLRLALLDKKRGIARQRDLFTVRNALSKLKKWADAASEALRHKYLIVSAELARVSEDDHTAIAHYEQAIKLAHETEVLRDEAIALELASKFYRSRNLPDVAIGYLARARHVYARWGAHAKVALLDHAYPGLAARADGDARGEHGASEGVTTTSTSSTGNFDVPSMVKATQALSREINFDKLLLRLMSIVAESAGAERGVLVLERRGILVVIAEFTAQDGARLPQELVPVTGSQLLSPGIVSYVMRTHDSVILDNASTDDSFTTDPYVVSRNPKAVLCTPLLQQGEVVGALYLENNLVPGAFTRERAELLSVLCAQMAISIDNASLYADLEQKVIERTRELRESQARVVQLEKEATEVQMAGGFAHEMRNALAGATLTIASVYRLNEGEGAWSACAENREHLAELYGHLREHLKSEQIPRAAGLLSKVNRNDSKVHDVLERVQRTVERGLNITKLILDYAQIGRTLPGGDAIRVRELVTSVLRDLEIDIASQRIQIDVDVPESCTIICHEMHLDAIVKNLITNAHDAICAATDDRPRSVRIQVTEDGEQVVLSVSDTGVGIAPEMREKIFEPFFSTKPSDGTGLGLGMARKLASLYRGTIDFESKPGEGSTFRVVMPRAGEQHDLR